MSTQMGLLTSATCHVLLRTTPSRVLTDMTCCPLFLMCSPPGPFNPLPILGSLRIPLEMSGKRLFGITRVDHNGAFLPCQLGSSCVSSDKMVRSSRRLIFSVVFCKVVECWPLFFSLSPPGDSVPFGPTPFSLMVRCLHTSQVLLLSLKFTFS